MFRTILIYGVIAGLVMAGPMVAGMVLGSPETWMQGGVLVGYSIMLVALSAVFLGVKHHRDRRLGGVIRFLPAFGVGLAITGVGGLFYVAGWELSLALTGYDFMETYTAGLVEAEKAKGGTPEHMAEFIRQMEQSKAMYRNLAFRMAITFSEIFPVGLPVSLASAVLLRNSRFLPARPAAA